jgi:hypothetical protein
MSRPLSLPLSAALLLSLSACNRERIDRKNPPEMALRTKIYVADAGNRRIAAFTTMTGGGWAVYKPAGAEDSLGLPTGVAATGTLALAGTPGGIFIADRLRNRIVRIADMSGAGRQVFNVTEGQNPARPLNVALGLGLCFIRDPAVLTCMSDLSGASQTSLRGSQILGTASTNGIDMRGGLSVSGNKVYVAATRSVVLLQSLTPSGNPPQALGLECCLDAGNNFRFGTNIRGIHASGDKIYVADATNNRVVKVDRINGEGWQELAAAAGRNFNQPSAVFAARSGIYIVDSGNNRIVRVSDMTGANAVAFAGPPGDGFANPVAIAVTDL